MRHAGGTVAAGLEVVGEDAISTAIADKQMEEPLANGEKPSDVGGCDDGKEK